MSLTRLFSMLTVAVASISSSAADTVYPQTSSYEFERQEDSRSITCNLDLTISNWPDPEVLNFRFIATLAKTTRAQYAGLSLDVGDLKINGGQLSRPQRVPLRSASFDSQSFSSTGRMTGVPTDKGVRMGTQDRATVSAFSAAFFQEPFRLTFTRAGGETSRTYVVSKKAHPATRYEFVACLQNSLRQAP